MVVEAEPPVERGERWVQELNRRGKVADRRGAFASASTGEAGHPGGGSILSAAVRRSRSAGGRCGAVAAEPPVERGDGGCRS